MIKFLFFKETEIRKGDSKIPLIKKGGCEKITESLVFECRKHICGSDKIKQKILLHYLYVGSLNKEALLFHKILLTFCVLVYKNKCKC